MSVPLPYNNERGLSHYIPLHILLLLFLRLLRRLLLLPLLLLIIIIIIIVIIIIIISFRLLRASVCYDNGNVHTYMTNLMDTCPFRRNDGGLVDQEIFCWSFYMKIHHAVTISRLWTLPLLTSHLRFAPPRDFALSDFAT